MRGRSREFIERLRQFVQAKVMSCVDIPHAEEVLNIFSRPGRGRTKHTLAINRMETMVIKSFDSIIAHRTAVREGNIDSKDKADSRSRLAPGKY